MSRSLLAAAAALILLAGCPLPQPLPDYARGTSTPPRIVTDGLTGGSAIIRVPAGCATDPTYVLKDSSAGATGVYVIDPNTDEVVVARWFVDYDADEDSQRSPHQDDEVPPAKAGASDPTRRTVPPFTFRPYKYPDPIGSTDPAAAGVLHVVELVVSAEFDNSRPPINRAPAVGFETQVHRWVFMTVPQSATDVCPTGG